MTFTTKNIRELFPVPPSENPLASPSAYWVLQSVGLVAALQILKHVPAGPIQQFALWRLRDTIDGCLAVVPQPTQDEIDHKLAQTLAPYVSTPHAVVQKMLQLANPCPYDVVLDLGSGDGRVVIEAARVYSCPAIGVEINEALHAQAEAAVSQQPDHVRKRITLIHGDGEQYDWSHADIVCLYWVSSTMARLSDRLASLRPGTKIVSHGFPVPGLVKGQMVFDDGYEIYLYVV